MTMPDDSFPPAQGQFLVYSSEDGRTKIEVRLEDETVWLIQQHMADLFQTTQQNISLHLQNIYDEGELRSEATHKESLSVRQKGARQVKRLLDFYNLDAFLTINDQEILTHAGRISHDMAKELAEAEYKKFNCDRIRRNDQLDSDFDKAVKQLPSSPKRKTKGGGK